MKFDDFGAENFTVPIFQKNAEILAKKLAAVDFSTLQKILQTNDKLTHGAVEMFHTFFERQDYSSAILSFDGIQYKYMAPTVFDDDMFRYVSENVFILSALYGVLKPFDAVVPYRLEMNSPVKSLGLQSMYDFWGSMIADEVFRDDELVLELTSAEYTRAIRKYITGKRHAVYCLFGEMIDDKLVEKGVYVKMARGDMVRYLAENNIHDIEGVKKYNGLGYTFRDDLSNENTLTFIKPSKK